MSCVRVLPSYFDAVSFFSIHCLGFKTREGEKFHVSVRSLTITDRQIFSNPQVKQGKKVEGKVRAE
jgi:hypothetical protein